MRRKIIAAARGCVARKGVHATMCDIAEETGMSLSTMYRYFEGKSEVMRYLADGIARFDAAAAKRISHWLTDARDRASDATPQQLRELLRPVRGIRARAEDRLRAEASRGPEIAATLRGGTELVRQSLQTFEDDRQCALLLIAAFHGAHMLRSLTEATTSRAATSGDPDEEHRGK